MVPKFVAWIALVVVPLYLPSLAMLVPFLRTRGGLDELRSTPLRARDVMWGSALSAATPGLALLVVGSVAHVVVCASTSLDGEVVPMGALFVYPWIGALVLGSTIAVAIFSASVARSILEARVFAFTALVAWLVVAPSAFGGPILDANPFAIYHDLDIVNFALRRRFASIVLPDHPIAISLAYVAVITGLLLASHAIFARRGFPAAGRSLGAKRKVKTRSRSTSGALHDR
ncbi:MAG TPA: hypothetical protein VK116_00425 [Planctomycetota bacterium]|nr:hypothetical protein [Planctomycetota bacterium]